MDPSVPSQKWELSREGQEAAGRLARSLATPPGPVYSSPETKAAQTARLLADASGLDVDVEGDLREVEGRPWTNGRAEYEGIVGRYLRGEPVQDWEERREAQRRMVAVVQKVMRLEGDVFVVSHGLVLALCLSWLLRVEPGTLFPVWQTMRFPDLCVIDWETRAVVRPFGGPI